MEGVFIKFVQLGSVRAPQWRRAGLMTFEYRLLETLTWQCPGIVNRQARSDYLYPLGEDRDSDVLEVLLGRLRRKLARTGSVGFIDTVRDAAPLVLMALEERLESDREACTFARTLWLWLGDAGPLLPALTAALEVGSGDSAGCGHRDAAHQREGAVVNRGRLPLCGSGPRYDLDAIATKSSHPLRR